MNFFVKLYEFFDLRMTEPTNYGWFHLMFMAIIIATTVLLCVFFKNSNDKTMRKIVLIFWIVIFVLEIYKQFNFSFSVVDNKLVWDFQWYAFPFQFCSTPLYAMPFIVFLKDGKIRDAFIAYMGAFSFFGGLAVFFYPNDVFVRTIGINIQTMVHHGLQVVFGIYFAVRDLKKLGYKYCLEAIPVFGALVSTALALNLIMYRAIDETFNMFYISLYYDCTLPILSEVYKVVPYIVFALIYMLGFCLVAFIICYAEKGIAILVSKIKELYNEKRKKKSN
jgi:hypothetical protein